MLKNRPVSRLGDLGGKCIVFLVQTPQRAVFVAMVRLQKG